MLHNTKPTQPVASATEKAPTVNDVNQLPASLLGIRGLESLVSDYVDASELVKTEVKGDAKSKVKVESSVLTNPSTFFESRLHIKKLLQHAAYGEKDQVEAMLKQNPLLLLEKGTVVDYSGRVLEQRTVYQIVLGAVDCDVISAKGNKVVEGMIEMIEGYFNKLPGKTHEEQESIKQAQYAGQFPAGQKEIEEARAYRDSFALNTVVAIIGSSSDADCKATNELEDKIHNIIRKEKDLEGKPTQQAIELKELTQAIVKASDEAKFEVAFKQLELYLQAKNLLPGQSFDFGILKAIYQFRNHLEPKGALTTGKHFNHELLAEAARLYNANYMNFGVNKPEEPYWAPKNIMCWQKVFGYVGRFVPACDGQVIAQGCWRIMGMGDKWSRKLEYIYNRGNYYFPLVSNSDEELGHNSSVGDGGRSPYTAGAGSSLIKLMSSKNISGARIMQWPDNQPPRKSISKQSKEELIRNALMRR